MEDRYEQHVRSFVGTQVIEFQKDKRGGGLIWEVGDYEHDGCNWNLTLRAEGEEWPLPVQYCTPFTPGSIIARANQVAACELQAGDRVFIRGGDGHRRGTVVEKNGNEITILYDKCEGEHGGERSVIPIESVLFNISAAIKDSNSSSYGPLFQVGDSLVTDQEYEDHDVKGTFRHVVHISEIKNDSKDLFELTDTRHEQMVDGQV